MQLDRHFWLKLFFESFLIIFSVLLALALNEYLTSRKEAERTRQALLSIREELHSNQEIIKNWHQIHREVLNKIEYYQARPGLHDSLVQNHQFQIKLISKGSLMPNTVRNNAWEIARNTGLLQNFDLAMANTLSNMYDQQRFCATVTADKLITLLFERQAHQQEKVPETLAILEMTMEELVGQESYLLLHYNEVLEVLNKALDE